MIPVNRLAEHDEQFIEALNGILATARVALRQGSLSRRNALTEIAEQAQKALKPA